MSAAERRDETRLAWRAKEEHLDEGRYSYAAPIFGYNAVLEVSAAGFVLDYPGLWRSAAGPLP